MKFIVACCAAVVLLVVGRTLGAESSPAPAALSQINRDIWEPFVRGVSTFDHALYSGVRAEDSVFIDGKRLFGYQAYVEDAIRVMAPLREAGARIDMEVRFEERLTNGVHAFERGVLRTIVTDRNGTQKTGYARFQAISRKQGDRWRIVTDYRWRADAKTDAAAFEAAHALQSLDAFAP